MAYLRELYQLRVCSSPKILLCYAESDYCAHGFFSPVPTVCIYLFRHSYGGIIAEFFRVMRNYILLPDCQKEKNALIIILGLDKNSILPIIHGCE